MFRYKNLLICTIVSILMLSCQNELVKKIEDQLQVDKPEISEEAIGLDKIITIQSGTPGADLYYTTDNTEPKPANPSARFYDNPIVLNGHGESLYLRVRGFKNDMTPSAETVAQFGNVYPSPPPPLLSQSGGTFSVPQNITISYPDLAGTLWEEDGVAIHYTLDGSSPTAGSPVYVPGVSPAVVVDPGTDNYTKTVILNAICVHPEYPASRAASAVYTVTYNQKAGFPTIEGLDTSKGTHLSGGVVFGVTEVTVIPPLDTTIHYRTRYDAGPWSEWTASSSEAVFSILDNSPRDGAVVTVQAYASRNGYRDSDMVVTSFSYLVLTVPPPIKGDDFTNGETYGRNLSLEFLEVPNAAVYYTLDGSVPVPGTEGIGGSSTHLYNGAPISGRMDWLYTGAMENGKPLFINAVSVIGGRVSPVSTYWCHVDTLPPVDPASSADDLLSFHEGVCFRWDSLSADTADIRIICRRNGVIESETIQDLSFPPPGDIISTLGLVNGETYDVSLEVRDDRQNENIFIDGRRVTVYSVTNKAGSGLGSLSHAVSVADPGDTVLFSPDVFDVSDGEDILFLSSTLDIGKSLIFSGPDPVNGRNHVLFDGDVQNYADLPIFAVDQSSVHGALDIEFRNMTFRNLDSGEKGSAVVLVLDDDSSVNFNHCFFEGNANTSTSGFNSSAVYIESTNYSAGAPSAVRFNSCVFNKNESNSEGGAIHIDDKDVYIQESLFVQNHCDRSGGAITVEDQDSSGLSILQSTFFDNTTISGLSRSVYLDGSGGVSYIGLLADSSIFWDSTNGAKDQIHGGDLGSVLNIILNNVISNGGLGISPFFLNQNAADFTGGDGGYFNGSEPLSIFSHSPANMEGTESDLGCYANADPNPLRGRQQLYVSEEGSDTNLGTSWNDSLADPQKAMDLASWYDIPEVWVKGGTYTPQSLASGAGTVSRDYHFSLKDGVALIGGFSGNGSQRPLSDLNGDGQTDPWEFSAPTVFSGERGFAGIPGDNFNHVIFHPNGTRLPRGARLDGIVVQDAFSDTSGGGLVFQSSITNAANPVIITNCTFQNNTAADRGGAVYIENTGHILIKDSFFDGNSGDNIGGAIAVFDSNRSSTVYPLTIEGSYFAHNLARNNTDGDIFGGGAIHADHSGQLTIVESAFYQNGTQGGTFNRNGGALLVYSNTQPFELNLVNCDFVDNSTFFRGGAAYLNLKNNESRTNIYGCRFISNVSNLGTGVDGGGACSIDAYGDVFIINSFFIANCAKNSAEGGAIRFYRTQYTNSYRSYVLGSLFLANIGKNAIYNYNADVWLINCTSFFDMGKVSLQNHNQIETWGYGETHLRNYVNWNYFGEDFGPEGTMDFDRNRYYITTGNGFDDNPLFETFQAVYRGGANCFNNNSEYFSGCADRVLNNKPLSEIPWDEWGDEDDGLIPVAASFIDKGLTDDYYSPGGGAAYNLFHDQLPVEVKNLKDPVTEQPLIPSVPVDLSGKSRVNGNEIDLGAYEAQN